MYDNEPKYLTYIGIRRRPLMFADKISNIVNVFRSNYGYKRTVEIWKRTPGTNDYRFIGVFHIDERNNQEFFDWLDEQ